MKTVNLIVSLLLISFAATTQVIPFDSEEWTFDSEGLIHENKNGKEAIYIKNGIAELKDVNFLNGTIEFDILLNSQRSFHGIAFRSTDRKNSEHFYFRPHLSLMPDASQYNPIRNGVSAWQLYHGPSFSAPFEYNFGEWMHVKLLVNDNQGEVYLDDMVNPQLTFILKKEPKAGYIALTTSFVPTYFANFEISEGSPLIKGTPIPEPIHEGTIAEWEVSGTFDEKVLEGQYKLGSTAKSLQWQTVKPDKSGILNLAEYAALNDNSNTVFAKATFNAPSAGTYKFLFGYSDRAKVYFNDNLIYSGNNGYRTRDYRHLGTIGLFEEIIFNMKKGKNEIWVAVSEDFGGWGIIGKVMP